MSWKAAEEASNVGKGTYKGTCDSSVQNGECSVMRVLVLKFSLLREPKWHQPRSNTSSMNNPNPNHTIQIQNSPNDQFKTSRAQNSLNQMSEPPKNSEDLRESGSITRCRSGGVRVWKAGKSLRGTRDDLDDPWSCSLVKSWKRRFFIIMSWIFSIEFTEGAFSFSLDCTFAVVWLLAAVISAS